VVIATRREALLRELEAELDSCGGSILVAPTDLSDDELFKRLVSETMRGARSAARWTKRTPTPSIACFKSIFTARSG
jgi:hypothetical protein